MSIQRFLITGGGTGGHIYPALAIAAELKARHPKASFLYVGGARGLESELVPREGYDFVALDVSGLSRKSGLKSIVSACKAAVSVFKAIGIVRKFAPDAVIGTGGYASFPVGAAALLCGRPLILHEQNVYPGLANRILARFAKGIAISWESSKDGFKGSAEVVHTGNPIRTSIANTTRPEGEARLKLAHGPFTVLVFGGSQGAVRINEAAIGAMKLSKGSGVRYILATGSANYEKYSSKAKAEGLDFSKDFNEGGKASYVVPYIHDMAAALAASDLVVSRAGALTLAEITANGIPSVLVPHPYVPDDVQRKNARAMEENGAAVVIEDPELDGEKLARAVTALAAEPERLEAMGKAAKKLAMPKAASLVADLVERHMRGGDAR